MEIVKDFIPKDRNNRPGFTMSPEFITIHDTGNSNPGANAKVHVGYLDSPTAQNLPVSWHFTVDENTIYQHLPLDENGWHAGDGGQGQGNRNSIGIEVCMNKGADRNKAEILTAKLVAYLFENVSSLLPFPDAMKQHFDWSGKNCPQLLRNGYVRNWQEFLDLIKDQKGDEIVEELTWQQKQAIDMIESLGKLGCLNDPEQHAETIKSGESLEDFVYLSLIERIAKK